MQAGIGPATLAGLLSSASIAQWMGLQVKEEYLACLKEQKGAADNCKQVAQQYLQCRMDRCAWGK